MCEIIIKVIFAKCESQGGVLIIKSLVELRISKNLTQKNIAKKLGIATSTYNMYENGQRKIPKRIATKIATLFEVDEIEIFLPVSFTTSKTKD